MPASPAAALDRLLAALVGSGTASAAVGLVGDAERVLWHGVAGEARPGAPAGEDTIFDYGSLTKPFMATLALVLDAAGELPLGLRLSEVWGRAKSPSEPAASETEYPSISSARAPAPALARRPLSDLLRHRAGLAAWTPLVPRCRSAGELEELLLGDALLGARAGTYSDLGYLLWVRSVERRAGAAIAGTLRSRVLAPLGLETVKVAPGDRPEVALCRCDTAREIELAARQGFTLAPLGPPPPGQPLDGNARFLLAAGWGLPGHAGLFGGARDLWRLGAEWLAPRRLLHAGGVAAALAGGGRFATGWWRRRSRGGGGRALDPAAFGHTGFPGGNLWIDPRARRVFVLLAHRADARSDMNRWRRRFHALAAQLPPGAAQPF